jgi:hypothetical protein
MQQYPERGDGGVTLIGISFDEYLKSDEVQAIIARDCVGLRAEARIKKEGRRNANAGSKVQSQYQVQLQGL